MLVTSSMHENGCQPNNAVCLLEDATTKFQLFYFLHCASIIFQVAGHHCLYIYYLSSLALVSKPLPLFYLFYIDIFGCLVSRKLESFSASTKELFIFFKHAYTGMVTLQYPYNWNFKVLLCALNQMKIKR